MKNKHLEQTVIFTQYQHFDVRMLALKKLIQKYRISKKESFLPKDRCFIKTQISFWQNSIHNAVNCKIHDYCPIVLLLVVVLVVVIAINIGTHILKEGTVYIKVDFNIKRAGEKKNYIQARRDRVRACRPWTNLFRLISATVTRALFWTTPISILTTTASYSSTFSSTGFERYSFFLLVLFCFFFLWF